LRVARGWQQDRRQPRKEGRHPHGSRKPAPYEFCFRVGFELMVGFHYLAPFVSLFSVFTTSFPSMGVRSHSVLFLKISKGVDIIQMEPPLHEFPISRLRITKDDGRFNWEGK